MRSTGAEGDEQKKPQGTDATRNFYDEHGWQSGERGRTVDEDLFGVREDGPIRREAHRLRVERIRSALAPGGRVRLLEMGCGANPEIQLLDLCSEYVGIDFSSRGVEKSNSLLSALQIPARAQVGDVCNLPFKGGEFDATYSAHCFYHIENVDSQALAFSESVRVLRSGGRAVLVLANPRPLLDPIRLVTRLVADAPVLGDWLRARRKSPVPYRPKPIGWMRGQLESAGCDVKIIVYAIASTWFNQNVSEQSGLGRGLWRLVAYVERRHPNIGAMLGNYVTIIATKR